ncbi:MAG: hypothetical protein IE936_08970 [Moraxella osloensis]|nr:hypothetical protein [Moraxella osloensis]
MDDNFDLSQDSPASHASPKIRLQERDFLTEHQHLLTRKSRLTWFVFLLVGLGFFFVVLYIGNLISNPASYSGIAPYLTALLIAVITSLTTVLGLFIKYAFKDGSDSDGKLTDSMPIVMLVKELIAVLTSWARKK